MGCRVDLGPSHVEVSGRASRGIEVDLSDISDTAPTLAVVAAFADSPTGSTASASSETRKAIVSPVRSPSCGGPVSMRRNTRRLCHPPSGLPSPATFDTYDDHRMAMAFSLVGLVVNGVEISDPGCVAKTFPVSSRPWISCGERAESSDARLRSMVRPDRASPPWPGPSPSISVSSTSTRGPCTGRLRSPCCERVVIPTTPSPPRRPHGLVDLDIGSIE